MDRGKVLTLLLGIALGAGTVGGTLLAYRVLSADGFGTFPKDCPLEFSVTTLNTTYGWFYRVVGLETEPVPLSEYSAQFFVYGSPDLDQEAIVHFEGPLLDLVGASGNFSFHDSGGHPGQLDDSGDYFFASTWHNLEVFRSGQVVGGTLGCA